MPSTKPPLPLSTPDSKPNRLKTLALILISLITTALLIQNDRISLLFRNPSLTHHPSSKHDYNKYVWSKTVLSDWDPSSGGRLIAIGDIHGMLHSVKKLLEELNYNPSADTVVLVGDLAAKHPSIQSSLDTVRYCRESKLEAVRGNHDQYIIIWRNWMEAHRDEFIEPSELAAYQADHQATLESDKWLDAPGPPNTLKHKLPEGMKWKAQHFEIARRLPKIDFLWMMERSLTIYVSPLSTYFVHAGMLPWNPPSELGVTEADLKSKAPSLLDVEENKNPYTLLEMRGLKKGRKPTKDGTKGKPWFKHWNKVMAFSNQTSELEEWDREPRHVVYGHWASRGLTIKPWSTGLDSGCVFGRRLSALVIGKQDIKNEKHGKLKVIPVQMYPHTANVYQIPCHKP